LKNTKAQLEIGKEGDQITEQKMERYSFSKLNSYHTCLMGFIFTYILKTESLGNSFSDFGTYCHKILEDYANGKLETYDLLAEFENGYDDNIVNPFPKLRNGKSMGDKYFEDGVRYFSNFEGFGDYKILAAEEKFEIQITDFIFNGFIDLVLEDSEGNIILWDHKSKSGFSDDEEERKYRRQLYLYSYFINEKYGKFPSKLIFNMFRIPEEKTYSFDEKDYQEAIKWMFDTVAKIRELYASYSWFFCNNICSFHSNCQMKSAIECNKSLQGTVKETQKLLKSKECDGRI